MRIYSYDQDTSFDEIFVYLTPEEINDLLSKLEYLLRNPNIHHVHFNELDVDGASLRELTISVYTDNNLSEFDERSKRLIIEGK